MTTSSWSAWQRRAIVWPAVFFGTPLLVVLSPLLFALAFVIDMLTGPRRLRGMRLLAMCLNYLVLVMIGLTAGFVLWLLTLFGLLNSRRWSQRAHHRIQLAWTNGVISAVSRWLRADINIEGVEAAGSGPMIVAARHASFFDALIPAVVVGEHRTIHLRYVLKQELLWEPCLDLYGNRLPNHFVDRAAAQSHTETSAINALAADMGSDAAVIFPEGTFRSARRATRVLERFAEREPERAARLRLTHTLPPRPGGLLALLDGAPDADLVFIAHVGFEPFGSLRTIVANVPFRRPVQIRVWRLPRNEIPDDPDAQLALVDEWWQRLDDWIAHNTAGVGP